MTLLGLAITLLFITGVVAVLPVRAIPLPGLFNDPEIDCRNASPTPAAVHVALIDPEDEVFLDVFLVADRGVTEARAREVLDRASEAYAPLNITLRVSGTQKVNFEGTDAPDLINQAHRLFLDDVRPKGTDIVAILTSVDIEAVPLGKAVAGLADCIGGIRSENYGFMVAEELGDNPPIRIGPAGFYGNLSAKVLAHEMGHLVGVHHHYANCAEGIPSELDENEGSACTLMTNFADFISINFGSLEGAVARGYVEEFARP